jgi:methyl-accepting chemotaxis protein
MNRSRDMIMLVLLLVVLTAGVVILDNRYRAERVAEVVNQFQLLNTLRRSSLEAYLETVRAEMAFWSSSSRIAAAAGSLEAGWQALGSESGARLQQLYITDNQRQPRNMLADAGDGSDYSKAHAGLHAFAREFVTGRGYYDFFLIDEAGNIIYTVEKEADLGTNLLTGDYQDTSLADVFRRALDSEVSGAVALSDLEHYAPSDGAPAIFAATRLIDAQGKLMGVLALQLPSDVIAGIMRFTEGMGDSGETYLVGTDLLMRSDSRFSDESTILITEVDTPTVKAALQGERGVDFIRDYRGVEVLSAYDLIEFDGVRWAVMAEVDAAEIERSAGSILASLLAAAGALFALVLVTTTAIRDYSSTEQAVASSGIDIDIDAG